MSYSVNPSNATLSSGPHMVPDQAQQGNKGSPLDKKMDELNNTLDVTETKKTFSSILALMTKGTVDLSNQIDQKLSD